MLVIDPNPKNDVKTSTRIFYLVGTYEKLCHLIWVRINRENGNHRRFMKEWLKLTNDIILPERKF